jgi:hypothetical protein
MWQFLGRRLLGAAVGQIGSRFFNDEANGPEVYADRIKRDFGLNDYADAWTLYQSDPAYWQSYYSGRPHEPDWKNTAVRDSAAAAGVPSRNNVFEYDFPQAAPGQTGSEEGAPPRKLTRQPAQPTQSTIAGAGAGGVTAPENADPAAAGGATPLPRQGLPPPAPDVFTVGAGPISNLPSSRDAPRGLPGMIADLDPADPTQPIPRPGGLAGLMLEYLRNNPTGGSNR